MTNNKKNSKDYFSGLEASAYLRKKHKLESMPDWVIPAILSDIAAYQEETSDLKESENFTEKQKLWTRVNIKHYPDSFYFKKDVKNIKLSPVTTWINFIELKNRDSWRCLTEKETILSLETACIKGLLRVFDKDNRTPGYEIITLRGMKWEKIEKATQDKIRDGNVVPGYENKEIIDFKNGKAFVHIYDREVVQTGYYGSEAVELIKNQQGLFLLEDIQNLEASLFPKDTVENTKERVERHLKAILSQPKEKKLSKKRIAENIHKSMEKENHKCTSIPTILRNFTLKSQPNN